MLNHLTIPVELNWMLSKKVWVLSNIHLTQLLFLLNIECYWVLLTPCYNSWVGTCALDIRPLMCVCVCVCVCVFLSPSPPSPSLSSLLYIHSFILSLTFATSTWPKFPFFMIQTHSSVVSDIWGKLQTSYKQSVKEISELLKLKVDFTSSLRV